MTDNTKRPFLCLWPYVFYYYFYSTAQGTSLAAYPAEQVKTKKDYKRRFCLNVISKCKKKKIKISLNEIMNIMNVWCMVYGVKNCGKRYEDPKMNITSFPNRSFLVTCLLKG